MRAHARLAHLLAVLALTLVAVAAPPPRVAASSATGEMRAAHDGADDHAHRFYDPAFERFWSRADRPVAAGLVSRSWLWGPWAFTDGLSEEYVESYGGSRVVQYFAKSRMELTRRVDEAGTTVSVSNGLLVVELMTGRLQLGDSPFKQFAPSTAQVAGDQRNYPGSPTYAALAKVRDAPAPPLGSEVRQTIDAEGNVGEGGPGVVTAAYFAPQTGHAVASVFWEALQAEGLLASGDGYVTGRLFEPTFAATGYPVTEAYWAVVLVSGRPARVLLQCFERRCLTYTPTNPPGFQVEAGNVGQHYFRWRYRA